MDRKIASTVKDNALIAIRQLHSIFENYKPYELEAEKELLRGIGMAISSIDAHLLSIIYKNFPDMDDLKDMDLSQFDNLMGSKGL